MTETSTATTTQSLNRMALYIHWPFCKKKCPYCDFNSHVRETVNHTRYRNALLAELRHMHSLMPSATLSSIFFGGGTPSLMQPDTAHALIEEAKRLWPYSIIDDRLSMIESSAPTHHPLEITLEANPTSVESDTFEQFKQAGINRVSLGIQSLRADALAFLGREHSAEEALKAIARARATFDRYSFDLIYALPHQTVKAWEEELKEALQHAEGHLSLYQLTIEPNTAFHTAYFGKKAFELPPEAEAAALYLRTQEVMEAAGLPAYEISNHARPGEASQHNLSYWRSGCYVGIGPGAHGRIHTASLRGGAANEAIHAAATTEPDGLPRFARNDTLLASSNPPLTTHHSPFIESRIPYSTLTHKTPERWLDCVERDGHGLAELTPISPEERMEEKLLMGLRLAEGLPLSRFTDEERAHLDARVKPSTLRTLESEGLLTISHTHWHATPRGRLVLNAIIEALLT